MLSNKEKNCYLFDVDVQVDHIVKMKEKNVTNTWILLGTEKVAKHENDCGKNSNRGSLNGPKRPKKERSIEESR